MEIVKNIYNLLIDRKEFFMELLIQHILLVLISVSVITIIGLFIGIYITTNKKIARIILSIASFIYTIPSIALFGFLVAIMGIGSKSAIFALSIYGLMPMIRNTYLGIMEVDKQVVEAAKAMGSTNKQLLFQVKLPLALPVIIAGFRTMVVMVIALGGIASFIGAGGLGTAIWRGITTNYVEMTIIGSLMVALLAISTDLILEVIEKKVRKKLAI